MTAEEETYCLEYIDTQKNVKIDDLVSDFTTNECCFANDIFSIREMQRKSLVLEYSE